MKLMIQERFEQEHPKMEVFVIEEDLALEVFLELAILALGVFVALRNHLSMGSLFLEDIHLYVVLEEILYLL
jgi:hypothetical protein